MTEQLSMRHDTEFMSRMELAAKLDVHPNTVDAMAKAGVGPKRYQLSRRRVGYRRSEVEAHYSAGTAAA